MPKANEPQPTHEKKKGAEIVFRVGRVSASVFVNAGPNGRPFRSVQLQRAYRDGDGTWKYAGSFPFGELANAQAALRLAFDHLAALEASPPTAQDDATDDSN